MDSEFLQKRDFVQKASINLMAAYAINNQLMYNHDEDACWDREKGAEIAVKDAIALWNELQKHQLGSF